MKPFSHSSQVIGKFNSTKLIVHIRPQSRSFAGKPFVLPVVLDHLEKQTFAKGKFARPSYLQAAISFSFYYVKCSQYIETFVAIFRRFARKGQTKVSGHFKQTSKIVEDERRRSEDVSIMYQQI